MNRPILYWLNALPDGYRERAVSQYRSAFAARAGNGVGCMSEALFNFAGWSVTAEGQYFWQELHDHYEDRECARDVRNKPLLPNA